MKTLTTRFVALLVAIGFLSMVNLGCRHTAHGFGKDVEHAGDKIEEHTR